MIEKCWKWFLKDMVQNKDALNYYCYSVLLEALDFVKIQEINKWYRDWKGKKTSAVNCKWYVFYEEK